MDLRGFRAPMEPPGLRRGSRGTPCGFRPDIFFKLPPGGSERVFGVPENRNHLPISLNPSLRVTVIHCLKMNTEPGDDKTEMNPSYLKGLRYIIKLYHTSAQSSCIILIVNDLYDGFKSAKEIVK